jgi:PPM family protein phosphatase
LGVLDDDFMILGHVGDSCCWQLRETEVRPLTTDHNVGRALAEHFVDHPLASDGSPLLRALSQCMGQPVPLRVDTIAHRLVPGTKLLFATDGVSGFLSEDEIARVFATDLSLPLQLSTLIDQVNERGAPDNATAVVLDIS